MNNLKATLFLYSIFNAVAGVALWFVPGYTADFFGINSPAAGYLFAMLGAAFLSSAFIFAIAGFNPSENTSSIKFAILWSALMLISNIYSLMSGYVTWGHIWFMVVLNGIFFISLAIFYPWKTSRK